MLIEDRVMPIRPVSGFGMVVARAGVKRSDLAKSAEVSKRTIDRLSQPAGYNDGGTVLPVSAWRIARAFGQLTEQTADDAFKALFTEE